MFCIIKQFILVLFLQYNRRLPHLVAANLTQKHVNIVIHVNKCSHFVLGDYEIGGIGIYVFAMGQADNIDHGNKTLGICWTVHNTGLMTKCPVSRINNNIGDIKKNLNIFAPTYLKSPQSLHQIESFSRDIKKWKLDKLDKRIKKKKKNSQK